MIVAFLVLNILGYFIINSPHLSKQLSWGRLNAIVKKSKKKIPGKILILGDSVGGQLFPRKTMPSSLTVNGGCLTVGHYILACNAVKKNKHLKFIVLACVPTVLALQFERSQTYQNVMKPFYTFENLKFLSKTILKKINKKQLAHFVIFPFVKAAACFSDIDFTVPKKKGQWGALSPTAIEYLKKLAALCEENNIKLVLISPPVLQDRKKGTRDWERMRKQIPVYKLGKIFTGYFENIIYLSPENFVDHLHLENKYLKKNRKKIIRKILPREVFELLYKKKGKKTPAAASSAVPG